MDEDRGASLVHQGRQRGMIWAHFSLQQAGAMHVVNLSTQPIVRASRIFTHDIPEDRTHEGIFLTLTVFCSWFARRAVLFSRTSFYRVKMTFLPPDMHCPYFQKRKFFFSKKTKGIFNMFALFLTSWHVLIGYSFIFICLHSCIIDHAFISNVPLAKRVMSSKRWDHQTRRQKEYVYS